MTKRISSSIFFTFLALMLANGLCYGQRAPEFNRAEGRKLDYTQARMLPPANATKTENANNKTEEAVNARSNATVESNTKSRPTTKIETQKTYSTVNTMIEYKVSDEYSKFENQPLDKTKEKPTMYEVAPRNTILKSDEQLKINKGEK